MTLASARRAAGQVLAGAFALAVLAHAAPARAQAAYADTYCASSAGNSVVWVHQQAPYSCSDSNGPGYSYSPITAAQFQAFPGPAFNYCFAPTLASPTTGAYEEANSGGNNACSAGYAPGTSSDWQTYVSTGTTAASSSASSTSSSSSSSSSPPPATSPSSSSSTTPTSPPGAVAQLTGGPDMAAFGDGFDELFVATLATSGLLVVVYVLRRAVRGD